MNQNPSNKCNCTCHAGHPPDCPCDQCSVRRCLQQCCEGKTKPKPKCPPPPKTAQPGTIDVPQPAPFAGKVRPPATDRPTAGSAEEVGWLSSQVQDMVRNGTRFGARKSEFLPYILVRSLPG